MKRVYNAKYLWRNIVCATVLAVAFFLPLGDRSSASPPNMCGTWKMVSSPNPGTSQNILQGVVALSATNIWTVGSASDGDYGFTLVEHWDGGSWNVVPSPNEGAFNVLNAITRVPSKNLLWAAGSSGNGHALIEYWNGVAWNIVPSLDGVLPYTTLTGIAAIGANNVWAVGSTNDGGYIHQTLIEHWNGTRWHLIPSPNIGSMSWLNSITAIAANNIWAVGAYQVASSGVNQTLIEHWDGSQWSIVPSPGGDDAVLNAVTPVAGTHQLWTVGSNDAFLPEGFRISPLTEHWDGTAWSIVSAPSPSTIGQSLNGIAAVSAKDVWEVGVLGTTPLLEHWDGMTWSIVSSTIPGSVSRLNAIAHVPGSSQVYAVGYYANGGQLQTYIVTNCS